MVNTLSPHQIAALSGSVKDAQYNEARNSIAEGSTTSVDFTVRVFGSVLRETGTPGGNYERNAQVTLATVPVCCAILRSLGIGPARLRKALESLEPSAITIDAEFSKIFDEVAAKKASLLPKVKQFAPGKSGTVRTNVNYELITP
jgi:hypothetical protein